MALAPTVSLTGSNVRDGCARANRSAWICLVQKWAAGERRRKDSDSQ